MTDRQRRKWMRAALALGGGALAGRVLAQADRNLGISERSAPPLPGGGSGTSLLVAKRRALVIGNSSYGFSPLKNPANDARALTGALQATGFEVTTALDFNREQMINAIRDYSQAVARDKAIGVFYFAGHGVQLAWRNYLLPTDAKVARMEQIQETCVDVNNVIDGISKAANPMNVVILDACRENPFGSDFRVEQKGLSQLDAPPGTLLAYATSPGNVASDGSGDNGLYTENLLKEIRTPEAKIEDVFKRVRLAVRRRSNGMQIPWESTSLEEDFWFLPPKELKRMAEADREREYKKQQAEWEKVQAAAQPQPIEAFLREYPSGYFAELAQFRLDRLLAAQGEQKVEVVSSAQNPYSLGTARPDTRYKVGDRYTYNNLDYYSKRLNRTFEQVITKITDEHVIYNDGVGIHDLLGNPVKMPDGRRFSANQIAPTDYTLGRRWTSRYQVIAANGSLHLSENNFRITKRERVTVPAGTFDCFVIEGRGSSFGMGTEQVIEGRVWMAPDQCRRPIKQENLNRTADGRRINFAVRNELAAFKQG